VVSSAVFSATIGLYWSLTTLPEAYCLTSFSAEVIVPVCLAASAWTAPTPTK